MVGAIVIAGGVGEGSADKAEFAPYRFGSDWGGWHAPLASIPIVGSSTIVRTVEYLRRSGVDEVSVFGGRSRSPLAVQSSTGDAEAWLSAGRQLTAYRQDGIETVLLIRVSGYVEFDLAGFLAPHRREGNVVSRAAGNEGALDLWALESHSFDTEADLVSFLANSNAPEYEVAGYVNGLQGPQDLRRLASDLLTGKCRMRPHGTEIRPGVWFDEGAQIARGARIVAPVYIGRDSKIADDCLITRCSNVENNSQIDFGTAVEDTSILSYTYVGIGLDLSHSVVDGDEVLNLHHQVKLRIADPVVVRRNSPRGQQQHRLVQSEVSEVTL